MKIKIDAIDTLIFRDGKPFGNEGEVWASSLPFPTPTTIYGALRGIYFAQNPQKLSFANTKDDLTKDLKIKGIYFYKNDEEFCLFGLPKDIVKEKDTDKLKILKFEKNDFTNSDLEYILLEDKKVEGVSGFLSDFDFEDYLNNSQIYNFYEIENFFNEEPKIGIALDKKRKNVSDGKLYRIGLKRYKNISIVVDFEGIDIDSKGLLKFGGEGKSAHYKQIDDLYLPKIDKIENNKFKLVLLTPAVFKNGWYPDFLDKNFEGEFEGIKLKLIAAAIDKSQYIGGWDIQNNKPKPMFRVVPAGSVYYFELKNEKDKNKIFEKFNYKSTVTLENYKKEGYGISVVGKIGEEL